MPRIKFFTLVAAGLCAAALPAGAQSSLRVLRTAEYRSLQQRLCRGWNTWSANSVMAHVHLPDGFALTLGVKTAGMGRSYQSSFFQANQTAGRRRSAWAHIPTMAATRTSRSSSRQPGIRARRT